MVDIDTWPTSDAETGEERWGLLLGRLTTSGVVQGPYAGSTNGDFKPYADSTGMVSKVGPGVMLIGGFMGESTGIISLVHNPAHATQHRYDRIIGRLSRTSPYSIQVMLVQGSTSGTQAGALAAMGALGSDDIALGYVHVAPASSTVALSAVTESRQYAGSVGDQWQSFTPGYITQTGFTVTPVPTAHSRAHYRVHGKTCDVQWSEQITISGASSSSLAFRVKLPIAPRYQFNTFEGVVQAARGIGVSVEDIGGWYVDLRKPPNSTSDAPTIGNETSWWYFSGSYEVA